MLPDNFLPLFLLHGGLFVKNKDANVASTVECMSVCVCVEYKHTCLWGMDGRLEFHSNTFTDSLPSNPNAVEQTEVGQDGNCPISAYYKVGVTSE